MRVAIAKYLPNCSTYSRMMEFHNLFRWTIFVRKHYIYLYCIFLNKTKQTVLINLVSLLLIYVINVSYIYLMDSFAYVFVINTINM
jgi:hypothetical protein